jgi:predicted transposase/invertase (TIGR01784 family)
MSFVDKVRENIKKEMLLEKAIPEAIDYCIENHILEDFLRERRMEVQKAMTLDYTWERREELIRREEREEGREEGHREEARQIIKNMLKNNFSLEIISECTNQPIDYINQIARELGTTEAFVQEETRYGK